MRSRPRLDTYHLYEENDKSYEQLYDEFEWEVPDDFDMAYYCCDKWGEVDPDRTALYYDDGERTETYTFGDVVALSNRFAQYLRDQGISRGDRVGVCVSQRVENPVAHVAAWKLGAVSVPMSVLSGTDTIEYKVTDADIELIVTEELALEDVRATADAVDTLEGIVTVDTDATADGEVAFDDAVAGYDDEFESVAGGAEDDAIINYTSGTTGKPKGVLHAHRHLLGELPEFLMGRNLTVTDDDVYRTAVDWSWIGSLNYVVLTSWFLGVPLVATGNNKFDAEAEYGLIEEYGISVYDAPATALRRMMEIDDAADRFDLSSLRMISSGGEGVGDTIISWIEEDLGATPREGYGQTEACAFVGDCPKIGVPHEMGKMGVAVPGHNIDVVDPNDPDEAVEVGEVGELVLEENPLILKEYLNKPEKTEQVMHDGWLLTGDLVREHEDGYIEYVGRKDGVIISSGYRIGPEEIEDCINELDEVADAGVVGVPDDQRGEVPKAFVVPSEGATADDDLKEAITDHTRDRLAAYKYPREIEFIDELPTTNTGKVARSELTEASAD